MLRMFCYISKYFYNSISFKFGFGIKVYLRFGVFSEGRSCVESEKLIYIFYSCVRCYISKIYFCFFYDSIIFGILHALVVYFRVLLGARSVVSLRFSM